jgi:hypothetical protein
MTRFAALVLAIAIGLAVALAPHASSEPDGLNRVAADHGFAKRAVDRNAASAKVARGVAAGGATLLVFAIGAGGAAALRRRAVA